MLEINNPNNAMLLNRKSLFFESEYLKFINELRVKLINTPTITPRVLANKMSTLIDFSITKKTLVSADAAIIPMIP